MYLLGYEGTELVAHEAVEYAAGLLSVDEVDVDGSGSLHPVADTGLGYLVELDAVDLVEAEPEDIREMP